MQCDDVTPPSLIRKVRSMMNNLDAFNDELGPYGRQFLLEQYLVDDNEDFLYYGDIRLLNKAGKTTKFYTQ